MKVFLVYNECASAVFHHKLAITLPAKWLELSADKVKDLFVERYNKKFSENELDDEELILAVRDESPFTNRDWKHLGPDDTPAKCFVGGGEVFLVSPPKATKLGAPASGKLSCRNFGCQRDFDEDANAEGSCRHHTEPPVFHDTRKWWGCCSEVKVFEFDELLAVPGCQTGRHSSAPPAIETERKAALAQANRAVLEMHLASEKPGEGGEAPAPKQNQQAAAAAPPPKKKARPKLAPGVARCKHYGCQADYTEAENGPASCCYHPDAPVFHEGAKKWACCGVTKYDFDDFLAVPGCRRGRHVEPEYDE